MWSKLPCLLVFYEIRDVGTFRLRGTYLVTILWTKKVPRENYKMTKTIT